MHVAFFEESTTVHIPYILNMSDVISQFHIIAISAPIILQTVCKCMFMAYLCIKLYMPTFSSSIVTAIKLRGTENFT
jgi:hypothetical protein